MKKVIKEYYKKKISFFIWGSYGLGKSRIVLDSAKEIAEESSGRKLVEWNKLSKEKKEEVYTYPEKYFVVIDIRLSEMDASDIKGLPKFTDNSETIDWKIPLWAKLMTLENSDGILTFEEINLATPIVMSSCYKIIYDRFVGEHSINKNWGIVATGNLDTDRAFTHTLPNPLKDRAGEVELQVPSVEDWTTDFATKNNIDSRIIAFLNMKESFLHKVDDKDAQKDVTPRGWGERLSRLIEGVKDYKILDLLCCSAIGEGVAKEFLAFCRLEEKMKLEELIKNPKKIKKELKPDIKFLLITAVAERYSKKDKSVNFNKVMEISEVFDSIENCEFVALLWRLCSSYTELFKRDFLNCKKDAFIERYGKFLI